MQKHKPLLVFGIILIIFGLFKPDLGLFSNNNADTVVSCVVDAPADQALLEKARSIIDIVKSVNDSTRKNDCLRLSSLYCDMATLIELNDEDQVIKDTATIREANILSGKMLRLNIKDKYENLAETSEELVKSAIGSNDVVLDDELRSKAVDAFRSLSWAFYEGSK